MICNYAFSAPFTYTICALRELWTKEQLLWICKQRAKQQKIAMLRSMLRFTSLFRFSICNLTRMAKLPFNTLICACQFFPISGFIMWNEPEFAGCDRQRCCCCCFFSLPTSKPQRTIALAAAAAAARDTKLGAQITRTSFLIRIVSSMPGVNIELSDTFQSMQIYRRQHTTYYKRNWIFYEFIFNLVILL